MENPVETIFAYGTHEIEHLRRCDPQMAALIDHVGAIRRPVTPDLFAALVDCIVSQQISGKAAETIGGRLKNLLTAVTPENVVVADLDAMRGCGVSQRKAGYIRAAADAVLDGRLPLDCLGKMDDAEVIRALVALPGIGIWTAEMLMIFSLQRPDILSYDDLIIRRALSALYGHESLSRPQFEVYRRRFSPYGSIASLYLWAYGNTLPYDRPPRTEKPQLKK